MFSRSSALAASERSIAESIFCGVLWDEPEERKCYVVEYKWPQDMYDRLN